jgi:hypothetical protein
MDTSAATKVLKQRNSANSAWVVRVPDVDSAGFEYVSVKLGAITATTTFILFCGGSAITISDIYLVNSASTTSDASNLWQIQVDNVTDTLNLRASAFSTNGSDFTANAQKALALDQNLSVGANKVLRITFTETGTATSFADMTAVIKFS